ncbi:TraR/DksA C4-type zinc finger protein [Eikenella corrodens]|uniref:TraR/DksA C4-type zinc finger protein n=1 Tax=Eikenella corrodens TaxID=539 RepID=UPI0030B92677
MPHHHAQTMSRQIDQACEIEEMHRRLALEEQIRKSQTAAAVSAYECEECGEPIPEERRRAVIGCRCCVTCQEEIEHYGKTRIAARRD